MQFGFPVIGLTYREDLTGFRAIGEEEGNSVLHDIPVKAHGRMC